MVPIRKGGIKSVGPGATQVTITFANDDQYATPYSFPAGYTVVVVGMPDWATSFRISTAPTVSSVTITFGTPAGVYGGNFYWEAQGVKLT